MYIHIYIYICIVGLALALILFVAIEFPAVAEVATKLPISSPILWVRHWLKGQ